MIVESVYGGIAENSYCNRAFDIVTLAHYLKRSGYASQLILVRNDTTWNSGFYFSAMLRLVGLPFISFLKILCFSEIMHDCLLLVFFNLPWNKKTFGFSPVSLVLHISDQLKKKIWSMLPSDWFVTICCSLLLMKFRILFEAAWIAVPEYATQSLYNLMLRSITAVIVTRGDYSRYPFLKIYVQSS